MIIICNYCNKNFEVNSELIPESGRFVQCGSCSNKWFYKKIDKVNLSDDMSINTINEDIAPTIYEKNSELDFTVDFRKKKKFDKDKKEKNQTNYSFFRILSFFIVIIVSLIGLIIILDTFKFILIEIFPKLELFLFNLFETLKDINLFIKDLLLLND